MYQPQWIQFTWNLKALLPSGPKLDSRYSLDRARPDERDLVDATLQRAYTTEQAWSASLAERLDFARRVVAYDMNSPEVEFWIIRHGIRVIAVSVLGINHASGRNLLTGICVQNEYRSRGFGTFLLYESLARLKTNGLTEATAVTKRGVTAEKFLYRKFNGVAAPLPTPEAVS